MSTETRERYGFSPVRNRLAEQNKTPLNQTYTIGSASRTSMRVHRAGSQEEDKLNKTFTSLFPRSYPQSNTKSSQNHNQTIKRMLSSQLPSLEGCSPERICCQRPWTRTQIELAKYKDTLKQLH